MCADIPPAQSEPKRLRQFQTSAERLGSCVAPVYPGLDLYTWQYLILSSSRRTTTYFIILPKYYTAVRIKLTTYEIKKCWYSVLVLHGSCILTVAGTKNNPETKNAAELLRLTGTKVV